jgi:hypothetical protein
VYDPVCPGSTYFAHRMYFKSLLYDSQPIPKCMGPFMVLEYERRARESRTKNGRRINSQYRGQPTKFQKRLNWLEQKAYQSCLLYESWPGIDSCRLKSNLRIFTFCYLVVTQKGKSPCNSLNYRGFLIVLGSGDRTRTCGLWVMSPTSYQLLHPALFGKAKVIDVFGNRKP